MKRVAWILTAMGLLALAGSPLWAADVRWATYNASGGVKVLEVNHHGYPSHHGHHGSYSHHGGWGPAVVYPRVYAYPVPRIVVPYPGYGAVLYPPTYVAPGYGPTYVYPQGYVTY